MSEIGLRIILQAEPTVVFCGFPPLGSLSGLTEERFSIMCKKLCLATGAVIVGLLVITFTGLGTLAQVKWHDAQKWMDSKVPPETKLKELQVEANKIDKDIKRHLGTLAAQEVEYERLDANLTARKEQQ